MRSGATRYVECRKFARTNKYIIIPRGGLANTFLRRAIISPSSPAQRRQCFGERRDLNFGDETARTLAKPWTGMSSIWGSGPALACIGPTLPRTFGAPGLEQTHPPDQTERLAAIHRLFGCPSVRHSSSRLCRSPQLDRQIETCGHQCDTSRTKPLPLRADGPRN